MELQITRRNLLIIVAIIIALIAIPLTIYLSQRSTENRSHASAGSADTDVIAIVSGQNITRGEVKDAAREQYEDSAIDQQALNEALTTLEERKILDNEASSKSLTADSSEVDALVESEGLTTTQAKYEVLKEKVTLADVKNWQVYVIGYWVPPSDQRTNLTKEEADSVAARLKDGPKALSDAQGAFASQSDAVAIAKGLIDKYPSLKPVLGVNGYFLDDAEQAQDLSDLSSPRVYTHDLSGVGQPFYDTLYSMTQPNEVKKVMSGNDSGGNVIKLIQANTSASFDTYEAWLAAQVKSAVQQVKPL